MAAEKIAGDVLRATGNEKMRHVFDVMGQVRQFVDAGSPNRKWNDTLALVETDKAALMVLGDWLQIDELLDRKPSQLPGGQRQRVAIGRANVQQAKVFPFDEPLSNLDAKPRTEMRVELKRPHKQLDATITYVTRDQMEAMTLAKRIAVMRAAASSNMRRQTISTRNQPRCSSPVLSAHPL